MCSPFELPFEETESERSVARSAVPAVSAAAVDDSRSFHGYVVDAVVRASERGSALVEAANSASGQRVELWFFLAQEVLLIHMYSPLWLPFVLITVLLIAGGSGGVAGVFAIAVAVVVVVVVVVVVMVVAVAVTAGCHAASPTAIAGGAPHCRPGCRGC
jgi:hypothetical protein